MNWIKRLPPSVWVAVVTLSAFLIRAYKLDYQSLWLDELWTMGMAAPQNSFADIYDLSVRVDGLSVLYFMIVHVFFLIFGDTEMVVRMISVLFGTLSVGGIYLLGRELFNRRTGLYAACVLCVNQFHIYYSQEGRSYAMFGAGVIFSFYFMLRFMREPNWRRSVYYGLSAMFMLLSHFYGLFVIAAQGLILIYVLFFSSEIKDRWKFFLQCSFALIIVVLGFLPEVPILQRWASVTSFWIPEPSTNAFMDQVYEFFGWSFNVINLSVLFILFFFFKIFSRGGSEIREAGEQNPIAGFYILTCWILVSFFIPYLRSYLVVPMVYPRYMMALVPALFIIIGAGIGFITDNTLRRVVIVLFMLIAFLEMSVGRKYYTRVSKSNFREIARYTVDQNTLNAEIRSPLAFHFQYYLKKLGNEAPVRNVLWLDSLIDAERLSGRAPKPFWILLAHNNKYQYSNENLNYLNTTYTRARFLAMVDASAELYVPKETGVTDSLVRDVPLDSFRNGLYENGELGIYQRGEVISDTIRLQKGNYQLMIKAQSTPAKPLLNEHAHLTVSFNDKEIGGFYIKPEHFLKSAAFKVEVPEEKTYRLKIKFDNDTCIGNNDRNAFIRRIQFVRR